MHLSKVFQLKGACAHIPSTACIERLLARLSPCRPHSQGGCKYCEGYTLLKFWTMLHMLQVCYSNHTGASTGQSEKQRAKQMPHALSLFRSLLHIGTQLRGQAIVSQRHMPRDQDHVGTALATT